MIQLTLEDCVGPHSPGRLLRAINRQMLGFAEARFADADLSFMQWIALKVVHDGQVRTAGELAHDLKMTSGSLTRLVDGLEKRGLMVRSRDDEDRRVVGLSITPAGTTKIIDAAPRLSKAWNDVLVDFDEDEFARFTAALRKLLGAFERNNRGLGGEAPDRLPGRTRSRRRAGR